MLNNHGIFAKTKKLTMVLYYSLKPTLQQISPVFSLMAFFPPGLGSNSVYPAAFHHHVSLVSPWTYGSFHLPFFFHNLKTLEKCWWSILKNVPWIEFVWIFSWLVTVYASYQWKALLILMYHCNSKPEHLMASWRLNFSRKSLILRPLLISASKHLGQYLSYLLNDFTCSSLRIIPHWHHRKFRVVLWSTSLGKVTSCSPSKAACLQGVPL